MREIDEAIFMADSKMLDDTLGPNFMGMIKLKTTFDTAEPLTSEFIVEETKERLFIKKTYNVFKDGLWHKQIIYEKCI